MSVDNSGVSEYAKIWRENKKKDPLVKVKEENKESNGDDVVAARTSSAYYSASTWIYELAWGKSFHFGRLYHKVSFESCLTTHEMYLFAKLQLPKTKEKWLDIGFGVGGPMRQAIRAGNNNITVYGVNNNPYQIKRCQILNKKLGMTNKAVILNGSFSSIEIDDNSIDKAYSIESTCHASDLYVPYSEIYRVLKPGGLFGCYEWVVTDKYDPGNDYMRNKLILIQEGCSLIKLHTIEECKKGLIRAGFEILEMQDLAGDDVFNPQIEKRWYSSLNYEHGIPIIDTLFALFMRKLNGFIIFILLFLESTGLIKPGPSIMLKYLNKGGEGLIESGRLGIYTPMLFFIARKPM